MNKLILTCFCLAVMLGSCGQKDTIQYANTIEVESTDTDEQKVAKAAHVIPTDNQLAALRNEFIAFVHIGPNTFSRREWGTGYENPADFKLETLNTDQWCEAMKAAGMKMVLLTVKHHDGFVLWQSRYTGHGVMSSPFRDGKGDILRDLSESCQKYGLKLGIYLSPADLYQKYSDGGLYGNDSQKTLRTIPRAVEGRPFADTRTFQYEVDDYNEYFLNQLFEVLTEYGPVYEVWFDGANPDPKTTQTYDYEAWTDMIHQLAPEATLFGCGDIRWCGNEAGATRVSEWNVMPYGIDPETGEAFPTDKDEDPGNIGRVLQAQYYHYIQAETDTSIREGWFYRDDDTQQVRPADDIFDIYERSVGGNSTLLLNIPPNREGLFSERDVKVLQEVGERITKTYGTNLLAGAKGPKELLDDDPSTFVDVTKPITISAKSPVTVNRVVIQEAIDKRSERIERVAVDAKVDGEWVQVAEATNVGYKRILRFADVTTTALRVRVVESRLTPGICTVSAHYYEAQPPQLAYSRTPEGVITIEPKRAAFNWKSEKSANSGAGLNQGYKVYYTIDGSEPTAESAEYTGPFELKTGKLKAVSVLNGKTGTVMDEQIGLPKAGWKVTATSEAKGNGIASAYDSNAATYWASAPGAKPSVTIDLGQSETLNGFAYTPQTADSRGMIAKGTVSVSADGSGWAKVTDFELGNLVNDPSKRYVYFDKPVTGRYVRIDVKAMEHNDNIATAAEFDVF